MSSFGQVKRLLNNKGLKVVVTMKDIQEVIDREKQMNVRNLMATSDRLPQNRYNDFPTIKQHLKQLANKYSEVMSMIKVLN